MIPPESFHRNPRPTLGVEIELQLVDSRTMALTSAFEEVYAGVPDALRDDVKPEFMQCYVELNTGVCDTVDGVGLDLDRTIRAVDEAAARRGVRLAWAATHPFSRWQDQRITPNERYYKLADLFQETVVRPVTFGLHVHVGVDSGDKAIRVMDRFQPYLPILLALSANSPFWNGRRTGHHAHRVEVLEGFPTGGLPPKLGSWEDYLGLVGQMRAAGFIESHRELWWDLRPNAQNGTVEVRICDMPSDLESVLGLTALAQCLVKTLSDEIDREAPCTDPHPVLIRQNRWRSTRFGPQAELVDPATFERMPARVAAERLADRLSDVAAELGCERHLDFVREMAARPGGSERQIWRYEETGDLTEVVRTLLNSTPREDHRAAQSGSVTTDFEMVQIGTATQVEVPAA